MEMVRRMFGLVENKGDEIFLNMGEFDTFEKALEKKKEKAVFRDKQKLFIIQRIDEVK